MPSYIASIRSGTPDGSLPPGRAAIVMVSAPTPEEARKQAAELLDVSENQVTLVDHGDVVYPA